MSDLVAILEVWEGKVIEMEKSVSEVRKDWFSAEAVAERRALYEAKVARDKKQEQRLKSLFGLKKLVKKVA